MEWGVDAKLSHTFAWQSLQASLPTAAATSRVAVVPLAVWAMTGIAETVATIRQIRRAPTITDNRLELALDKAFTLTLRGIFHNLAATHLSREKSG